MKSKRFAITSAGVAIVVLAVAVVALARFALPTPKHCRLVFGPQAAIEVTLEVAGNRLLVYRGGNPAPEQFGFVDGQWPQDTTVDIRGAGSDARYTITSVSRYQEAGDTPRDAFMIDVTIENDQTKFEQYCDVELREMSTLPAIAHFDGPLTVSLQTINWQIPKTARLVRGETPTDIRVMIGTMDFERGCWTATRTHHGEKSAFPEGVFPYVEVEFPPKSAGEPSPKEKFALDEFC